MFNTQVVHWSASSPIDIAEIQPLIRLCNNDYSLVESGLKVQKVRWTTKSTKNACGQEFASTISSFSL